MAVAWILLLYLAVPGWWDPPPELAETESERALHEVAQLLLANPIDINRATAGDLQVIPWLNPLLAFRIVALRDSLGGLREVEQLHLVPGLTDDWYEVIAPFVSIESVPDGHGEWQGSLMFRLGADSLSLRRERFASLGRLLLTRGRWQLAGVAEKDRGESDCFDWLGLSACYRHGTWALLAGSFTLGSGLGLVFSGPQRSAGDWRDGGVRGPDRLRPSKSPDEVRARTGAGVEFRVRRWDVSLAASLTGRDARLNPDGTVARLTPGGVHDDSVSRAAADAVREFALGSCVSRDIDRVRVSVSGAWVRYSRAFAPAESLNCFRGRSLGVCGLAVEAGTAHRRIAVEAALTPGSGSAGSAELSGTWKGLSAGIGIATFGMGFFAPLGRSSLLMRRERQLLGRVRAAYRSGGFGLTARGNTSCDYVSESLPGRVGIELTQRFGALEVGFALGRRFRLDRRTFRTGRWSGRYRSGPSEVRFSVEDAYPENGTGRGTMVSISGRVESRPWSLAVSGARFDINGSGIRMWLREQAPVRGGSGFATSVSAWRCALTPGFSIGRDLNVTIGMGMTFRDEPTFDVTGQVEVPFP